VLQRIACGSAPSDLQDERETEALLIAYVTGLLGSGKSLYAVRKIARKLLAGGVVATNIELGSHPKYPEWWKELLKHAPYYRLCRDPEKRWQY
jgi:hypothetical protein